MYIYTPIIFNIRFSFIRIFCKIISLSKNLMGNLNKCKMSHFSNQKLRHLFFCFNFPYNWYPRINNLLVSKLAQSTIYKCRIFILIKEIFDSIRKKKNHKITKKTVWVLCHDDANSPLWCLHRVKVTANHRHKWPKIYNLQDL